MIDRTVALSAAIEPQLRHFIDAVVVPALVARFLSAHGTRTMPDAHSSKETASSSATPPIR